VDRLTARQIGLDKLSSLSKSKGYISFDDILNITDSLELPIDDVDRISETLLLQGIIIREKDVHKIREEESFEDRSKLDYEQIFNQVVDIDPSLSRYIAQIKLIVPPQYKEVDTLIFQAKDGNIYAHERIITMYLKVVIRMALWACKKYQLPLDETISNGNIGLLIALEKFDPNGAYKFSNYAPLWIRQLIMREAQVLNPHIYFPVHVREKLFSIYDIYLEHFCEKCDGENICNQLLRMIADKLKCTLSEAMEYINYLKLFESIEEQLENNEQVFSDEGVFEEEIYETYSQEESLISVAEMFKTIKPREAEVLQLRLGLLDGKERTLEEVGQSFGVTRERIRQIEAKAILKLQHPSRSKKLKVSV